MGTLTSISSDIPTVGEEKIQILLFEGMIGSSGYELPIRDLNYHTLCEIMEMVSDQLVLRINLQFQSNEILFESSFIMPGNELPIKKAIRQALIKALAEARKTDLLDIQRLLMEAHDRCYSC